MSALVADSPASLICFLKWKFNNTKTLNSPKKARKIVGVEAYSRLAQGKVENNHTIGDLEGST
jgi:hypothetical protein